MLNQGSVLVNVYVCCGSLSLSMSVPQRNRVCLCVSVSTALHVLPGQQRAHPHAGPAALPPPALLRGQCLPSAPCRASHSDHGPATFHQ